MTDPLSLRAIRYGAALRLAEPLPLAERLYRYNSHPYTPAWRRRVAAVRAALRAPPPAGEPRRRGVWRIWEADPAGDSATVCKLYVSPHPLGTAAACAALLARLGARGGPVAVKVAIEPAMLLRPDRIVAYFATRAALDTTAEAITPALAGAPAEQVPFTAAHGAGAGIAWAVDPPPALAATLPERERSWRGWVTGRIADALVATQAARDPAGAALRRLRDAGITPDWTPPWPSPTH